MSGVCSFIFCRSACHASKKPATVLLMIFSFVIWWMPGYLQSLFADVHQAGVMDEFLHFGEERPYFFLLLRGDLEGQVRRRFLFRPLHGGHFETQVDDVERAVFDQLFETHQETLFAELSGNLDLGSGGDVLQGFLGLLTCLEGGFSVVLPLGFFLHRPENLPFPFELPYGVERGERNGIGRADVGTRRATDCTVHGIDSNRMCLLHLIDISTAGDVAQLAANARLWINCGIPRNLLAGDAVPGGLFLGFAHRKLLDDWRGAQPCSSLA